jgi:uncharacterized coiled-coil DUF342 family protein
MQEELAKTNNGDQSGMMHLVYQIGKENGELKNKLAELTNEIGHWKEEIAKLKKENAQIRVT